MNIAFAVFISVMILLLLIFSLNAKNRMKYFICYAVSGLAAYFLLCIIGNYYEAVKLNLNWFNLLVSASCGAPGVLFLLALKYLL